MSNAYPRPGADEPAWPDVAGDARHREEDARRRDGGAQQADERQLRAVPPSRLAWQPRVTGGAGPGDRRPAPEPDHGDPYGEQRPTSWTGAPGAAGRGQGPAWADEPPAAPRDRRDGDARDRSWADAPPPVFDRGARPDDVPRQAPPPSLHDRVIPSAPAMDDHGPPSQPPPPPVDDRAARSQPPPAATHALIDDQHGFVEDEAPARFEPDDIDEIEDAVPAGQRLTTAFGRLGAGVRSSVPLRTALFVLPPLVLPALAFDLSLPAALVVSVLLLWLAAAAGVIATMMFEGSDQLALRAIERHLERLQGGKGVVADDEALLAVGAQLDALNDRLDELVADGRGGQQPAVEHRPQEQWPASEEVDQNDGYDHDVVSGRHWSPPRWER